MAGIKTFLVHQEAYNKKNNDNTNLEYPPHAKFWTVQITCIDSLSPQ